MKKEIKIISGEEEIQNFSKGYLTIPFEGDQFANFIRGLLSSPQTLSKTIEGHFEIHLKDLQNFHDLISQRIIQQNDGMLIQFRTKVYFSDGSSVTLGSYDQLISYNEVKPIRSVAVRLNWEYLINFADRETPEKQSIELLIVSGGDNTRLTHRDIPSYYYNMGEFRLLIQHTARSWAYDIEALITNQVKSHIREEDKIKRYVRKKSSQFALVGGGLYLIISIIGAFLVTKNFTKNQLDIAKKSLGTLKSDGDKLDFLISSISSGKSSEHFYLVSIFILIQLIASTFMIVIIDHYAENTNEPSFIVLTRKAKEFRDKIVNKRRKNWNLIFYTIIIGIIVNIISSYIFDFLAN